MKRLAIAICIYATIAFIVYGHAYQSMKSAMRGDRFGAGYAAFFAAAAWPLYVSAVLWEDDEGPERKGDGP